MCRVGLTTGAVIPVRPAGCREQIGTVRRFGATSLRRSSRVPTQLHDETESPLMGGMLTREKSGLCSYLRRPRRQLALVIAQPRSLRAAADDEHRALYRAEH